MSDLPPAAVWFHTWQFSVLAYLVALILFFQFYRLAVKTVTKDGAATIVLQIIGAVSSLVFLPLFPISFPKNIWVYVSLAIACVFYAIMDRINTTVRKHVDVSTFSIISELSNVFLIIISLTIMNEDFIAAKVIGGGLILLANFALLYQRGRFAVNRYVNLAILAQLAFSVALSIDINISEHFSLPIYIFISLSLPALIIALYEKHDVKALRHEWFSANKLHFGITGIAWGMTVFFMLRSFQLGPVTTVVPIAATSVLLNVIVAAVFLKEHNHMFKKAILAILIIVGATITVVS